jgi:protein gp37
MAKTSIEWCDYTFNGWIGCTKLSPACDSCYAADWGHRFGVEWGPGAVRRPTAESTWQQPHAWNRKAQRDGVRYRVFCNSLSDVFDAEVPDEWRARLFALIEATPHLDWLVLTKRTKLMADWAKKHGWPKNAWAGTTVENQKMANLRVPHLMWVPAPVIFLSMEPLLGPVNLNRIEIEASGAGGTVFIDALAGRAHSIGGSWDVRKLDWVIAGAESGKNARPTNPRHLFSLRDQCAETKTPFLFKQWGEWGLPLGPGQEVKHRKDKAYQIAGFTHVGELLHNPFPVDAFIDFIVVKYGSERTGRLLGGREYNEFPTVPA